MGGSYWSAHVPYRTDLEAALQQARWDVYRSGEFFRDEPDLRARSMAEEEYVAWHTAWSRASWVEAFGEDADEPDYLESRIAWRAAQIEVTGPDTLLESQPFSGTHSVIDMTGIAEIPTEGMVAPVPADMLDEVFGTRRPTATDVEQAVRTHRLSGWERWEGLYVVAYDGDTPNTIFFTGVSGD
ncbi:hypothetical protein Cch02nite_25920 [Catellatospora chokoriensis]|uniref:Uncharacterized protein n=2 Tax=Catellatospora chokoriensis TaxID=310353 RepID=A0A8J3K2D5_9ACTN|nr:hypothetical protein Cch02nite_25920 [Catellatospora chokoriensis]